MDQSLVVCGTLLSANCRKVLAVAKQLDLKISLRDTDVYKGQGQEPEYLAINPLGKIPTLIDGDFILNESNAIMLYLAEVYGDYKLSSTDPKIRAEILSWMFWESSHWQPAISIVLSEVVGHELIPQLVPAPMDPPKWNDDVFINLVKFMDSHLVNRTFICNNELSIADFSIAGMMTYFHFAQFPFAKFPSLKRWYESIEALESWSSTDVKPWKIS